jgi:S-adenosylmethionine hydrolase
MFGVPAVRALDSREWEATVIHVDRFGNLTTNLTSAQLDAILAPADGDPTEIVVVVEGVVLPYVRTYSDVPDGEACALMGSSGRLEVAVSRGNASRLLGALKGAAVRVRQVAALGG